MKILVVDRCKEARRRLVEALCDLTNVVVMGAVSDLEGARPLLAETPVDVVVTDRWEGDLPHTPEVIVFSNDAPAESGSYRHVPRDAGVHEVQATLGELRRARRDSADPFPLLGRIAAGVAHDLSNYLTTIQITMDLLARRPDDDALLSAARAAIDSAARLNRSVVEYARGAPPNFVTLDLDVLVRRMLTLLARTFRPEIRVVIANQPGVRIRGIVSEVEQVVLNLVLNACDAMPRGGELRVGVREIDGRVYLEVDDGGDGFAPDGDGALSPSTKPDRPGVGLGLGIVRGVIDHHHARLRVRPRATGGTSVVVTFAALNG